MKVGDKVSQGIIISIEHVVEIPGSWEFYMDAKRDGENYLVAKPDGTQEWIHHSKVSKLSTKTLKHKDVFYDSGGIKRIFCSNHPTDPSKFIYTSEWNPGAIFLVDHYDL
jgi:hypothetical protein